MRGASHSTPSVLCRQNSSSEGPVEPKAATGSGQSDVCRAPSTRRICRRYPVALYLRLRRTWRASGARFDQRDGGSATRGGLISRARRSQGEDRDDDAPQRGG